MWPFFSCHQDSVNQSVAFYPFLKYFLAMKSWKFSLLFDVSETEGEENETKAGPPGEYFVIMNKINVVLFFCTIHILFFKI